MGLFYIVCAAVISLLLYRIIQTLEQRTAVQLLPDYDDVVQFDPEREGGHLLPNLNLDVRGEFGPVHFITNSKGFRNAKEFQYTPPSNVYRILLLGDSYVDGMRTAQEQTIGAVLQEILNAHLQHTRQVEVLISGQNNPANAWYAYQEHGHKYHPELVILGLTIGNDFTGHNYGYGLLPETGENGQIVLRKARAHIDPASHGVRVLLPSAAYQQVRQWEWITEKEFRVREWLAAHFRLFGYAIPPLLMPWGNEPRHVCATDAFLSLGLFSRLPIPEIEEMYRDMDAMLTGMYRAVTAHGATFLLVLFPVRIQVAEADWRLLVRGYALDPSQFDLQKPNQHILALCERWGIECLDSLPALRQWYERHGEPVYRARGDMHFNERGQRVVAESIATHILTQHAQALRLYDTPQ